MPSIHFTDNSDEGKARQKRIEETLPKEPIVSEDIDMKILNTNKKKLIEMLKAEIEVYKAYPRKGTYDPDNFTPRNSRKCFMGQGFTANGHGFEGWTDYDLVQYRNAVGKIEHGTWGNCTLLEIWGGDHYQSDNDMVVGVFKYCYGMRKTLPILKFNSIPFILTELTGKLTMREDEKDQAMDEYFTNANYIRISKFDMPPYKDWDSMPDEVKQDFEEQWKNRDK